MRGKSKLKGEREARGVGEGGEREARAAARTVMEVEGRQKEEDGCYN